MKYPLLCILISNICTVCSQNIPLFETRLFFEDQVGNKDTLSVGFDTAANEILNLHFGEINLMQPFSGELDVRAAHRSILDQPGFEGTLSKRIITKAEKLEIFPDPGFTCHNSRNIILFVRAKHFPVRITWDSSDFVSSSECIYNSFITPDYNVEVIDPLSAWIQFPGKRFSCMRNVNQFMVNLDPNYRRIFFPSEYTYRIIRSFSSSGFDTLYGLSLFFTHDAHQSPCNNIVDEKDVTPAFAGTYLFPNPAEDKMNLDNYHSIDFEEIHIINTEGHILKTLSARNFNGDISLIDVPCGVYQLVMKKDGMIRLRLSFIKV